VLQNAPVKTALLLYVIVLKENTIMSFCLRPIVIHTHTQLYTQIVQFWHSANSW